MKKLSLFIMILFQTLALSSLGAAPLGSHSVLETLSNLARASGSLSINIESNSWRKTVDGQIQSASAFSETLEAAIDLIQLPDLKRQLNYIKERVQAATSSVDKEHSEVAREQKRIFRDVKKELLSLTEIYAERLRTIAKDQELGRLIMLAIENPDTIPAYIQERLKQFDTQLAAQKQTMRDENQRLEKEAQQKIAELEKSIREQKSKLGDLTKQANASAEKIETLGKEILKLQRHEAHLRSNLDQMRKLFANGAITVDFLGREVLDLGGFAARGDELFAGLQSQVIGVLEADLNVTHRLAEAIQNRKLEYRPNMTATFRFVNAEIINRGYFRSNYLQLTAFITIDLSWGFIHTYERSLPVVFVIDPKGRIKNDDEKSGPHASMKLFLNDELPRQYLGVVNRIATADQSPDFRSLIAHCEEHLLSPVAAALERQEQN